jgi:phosphoglycolate phosphatase-like HAD superfamily hydrolase
MIEAIPCYLFDVDGTLADPAHRQHHLESEPKDWDTYFEACKDDAPITHMISLAQTLISANQVILFATGRPDRVRVKTQEWLSRHLGITDPRVYMRKDEDHHDRRDDDIVKEEYLAQIRTDGYKPIMAFEDRSIVVAMWRRNGISCAQVAEAD